jgi:hypothetical protein
MFAGFGGILLGNNDNGQSFSQNFTITDNTTGVTRTVTLTGRQVSAYVRTSDRIACSGTLAADSNIALLPHRVIRRSWL